MPGEWGIPGQIWLLQGPEKSGGRVLLIADSGLSLLGYCRQVSIAPPNTDTPRACDPVSRGHSMILLIWALSPATDMLIKKLIPGPSFPSLYGNSSVQRGWWQWNPHCFKQIWSQMHRGRKKKKLNYSCRGLVQQHLCSPRVAQPANASHICHLPPQSRWETNPLSEENLPKTPLLCLGYLGPAAVTSHSSCNCSLLQLIMHLSSRIYLFIYLSPFIIFII